MTTSPASVFSRSNASVSTFSPSSPTQSISTLSPSSPQRSTSAFSSSTPFPFSPNRKEPKKSKSLTQLQLDREKKARAESRYISDKLNGRADKKANPQDQFDNLSADQQWWRLQARRMLENVKELNTTRAQLQNERDASQDIVQILKQELVKTQQDRQMFVNQVHAEAEKAVISRRKVCELRASLDAARATTNCKHEEVKRMLDMIAGLERQLLRVRNDTEQHTVRCSRASEVRLHQESIAKQRYLRTGRWRVSTGEMSTGTPATNTSTGSYVSTTANTTTAFGGNRISSGKLQQVADEPCLAVPDTAEDLAAVQLQSFYRGSVGRNVAIERREDQAVEKIQRAQRGKAGRKKASSKRKEKEAAVKIQSLQRGRVAKEKAKTARVVKMRCSCGETLKIDATFCGKCGKRVQDIKEELEQVGVVKSCLCGNAFKERDRFCMVCGQLREALGICSCGNVFSLDFVSDSCGRCDASTEAAAVTIQSVHRGNVARMQTMQIQEEVQKVAAVENCLCGKSFSDRDSECSFCGQLREELAVCSCRSILAPDCRICRNCGAKRNAQVSLSFTVRNVNYSRLAIQKSDRGIPLLNDAMQKLQECIAMEAGDAALPKHVLDNAVLPKHVLIEVAAGPYFDERASLQVRATVDVPDTCSAISVKANLVAAQAALAREAAVKLQCIRGIQLTTTGIISVDNMRVTRSETLVESPAQALKEQQGTSSQELILARRHKLLDRGTKLQRVVKKIQAMNRVAKQFRLSQVAAVKGNLGANDNDVVPIGAEVNDLRTRARKALQAAGQDGRLGLQIQTVDSLRARARLQLQSASVDLTNLRGRSDADTDPKGESQSITNGGLRDTGKQQLNAAAQDGRLQNAAKNQVDAFPAGSTKKENDAALKIQRMHRGGAGRQRGKDLKEEALMAGAVKNCLCGEAFKTATARKCSACGQLREELGLCSCGSTLAPQCGSCVVCGMIRNAEVGVSFTVRNANITAKSEKKGSSFDEAKLKLKGCIAQAAGDVLPENVHLEMALGSKCSKGFSDLQVQATIKVYHKRAALLVKSKLSTSKVFSQQAAECLETVAGKQFLTASKGRNVSVANLKVTRSETLVEPSDRSTDSSRTRKLSRRVLTPPVYLPADSGIETEKSTSKDKDVPDESADSKLSGLDDSEIKSLNTVRTTGSGNSGRASGLLQAGKRASELLRVRTKPETESEGLAERLEKAKASGAPPKSNPRQPKAAGALSRR